MKLTPQVARELNKKGSKISSNQIIRTRFEEKVEKTDPVKIDSVKIEPVAMQPLENHYKNISAMLSIMGANEANMNGVLEVNKAMSEVLLEMAKPKPKKSFVVTFGRGTDGKIKSPINVKEQ